MLKEVSEILRKNWKEGTGIFATILFIHLLMSEARAVNDWLDSLVEHGLALFIKLVSILGIDEWMTWCFYVLFSSIAVISG